jgi:hypothetical protein
MKFISRLFRLFALVVIALLSLVLALPVLASSGAQAATSTPIDVRSFLQWLIGGGGSILAVSWILERTKWFQSLTSDAKDYTIFGFAVVVGCGALAAVMYVPSSIIDAIAPFFLIVASIFVTVFIVKSFHSTDKVGSSSNSK